jgi:hypothetical protein
MISIETLASITLLAGKRATLRSEQRFPSRRIVRPYWIGVRKEKLAR